MADNTLIARIRALGAEETSFAAAVSNEKAAPAKLRAAYAMLAAAEAGTASFKDAQALTKAYFEGKTAGTKDAMPKSLAQQQSKFGVFLKAGDKGIGDATRVAVAQFVGGINDTKDKNRAVSSIFEKMASVMRAAVEDGSVPDYATIRGIMLPEGGAEDEALANLDKALAALGKAEAKMNGTLGARVAELVKGVSQVKDARAKESQAAAAHANRATVAPEGEDNDDTNPGVTVSGTVTVTKPATPSLADVSVDALFQA